ncbi:MAG: HAMP domain-containing histidine kinase [Deltaproteobacteria bacterium]|nr:HAMP domain-containing histidine kinase [Deltaproteobacteria bacterium]
MPETINEKDRRIEILTRQLESRTELTRMIVHDLKGPLGSIMANLDLLISGRLGREEREILETALQGGNDLLNIINTLLEIGKMERGKLELNLSVINLSGMFEAAVSKLKSLASQKNIALEIDCRSKTSSIAVDASLIERILFNLVLNAVKYTREGGTITLRTEDGRSKDTVLIAVSDTGIGIPKEFQETIFDLYTQLRLPGERKRDRQACESKGVNEGAGVTGSDRRRMVNVGLGLAFCKLAAKQHGGSIWVESEMGKGSTFFVSLPTNLIPSGSGLI